MILFEDKTLSKLLDIIGNIFMKALFRWNECKIEFQKRECCEQINATIQRNVNK